MKTLRAAMIAAAALAGSIAAPALANVKAGVDAWSRGDYDRAVAEWRAPAQAGDPDAMFNMAQAYRLGRGVQQDAARAEQFYKQAAQLGHLKAADNLGLLLFQAGRREEAMPYVTAASSRGDPRAQYLLGIAHFNGDLVEKDWTRAYALLTLANAAGLPQAAPAIRQMDDFIPLEQRQAAQPLAQAIKRDSDTRRASQLAAADLATESGQASVAAAPRPQPRPVQQAVLPARPQDIPRPIPSTTVAPSVVAAQAAVAEAVRVTGTESPAEAGADFASRSASSAPPASSPTTRPAPRRAAPAVATRAASAAPSSGNAATGGPWKIQLGAFSVRGNAERLWSRLSGRSELSGAQRLLVPAGRITKLQAGGFASRNAAQNACNQLKRSGQDCLVTR